MQLIRGSPYANTLLCGISIDGVSIGFSSCACILHDPYTSSIKKNYAGVIVSYSSCLPTPVPNIDLELLENRAHRITTKFDQT